MHQFLEDAQQWMLRELRKQIWREAASGYACCSPLSGDERTPDTENAEHHSKFKGAHSPDATAYQHRQLDALASTTPPPPPACSQLHCHHSGQTTPKKLRPEP